MTPIPYSRLSTLAITSAASGVIASLGILIPQLALISILGIVAGYMALKMIRRYEFSGTGYARLGQVTSILFAGTVSAWPLFAFWLETPFGYRRLNYHQLSRTTRPNLAPAISISSDRANEDEPLRITLNDYVGESVCLKGYVWPDKQQQLTSFVLSPDGSGNRLLSHVLVELSSGQTWTWNDGPISVCGTLERVPLQEPDGVVAKYVLKNATVRPSYTRYLLQARVSGRC